MSVVRVSTNVRWLDQHGVHVYSDFKDRIGIFAPQRKGTWRDVLEWTVASPIDICAGMSQQKDAHEIVERIGRLPSVRSLNLATTRLSSEEIQVLCGLPHLEELTLSSKSIDDSSVKLLKSLTNLRMLDLSETAVTDASLQEIANLKSLQTVSLHKTNVTPRGLLALRRVRPDLNVLPKRAPSRPRFHRRPQRMAADV